jgi:hypothetical protein
MDIEQGSAEIVNAIKAALARNEGLLVGRNGTIELETLFFKLFQSKPGQIYPSAIQRQIELNAGVFPPTQASLDRWVFSMVEAIRNCDVLVAGWYKPLETQEQMLLETTNKLAPRIPLRSLEPYYVEPSKRWTSLLQGEKVAIVNAFAKTAVSQTNRRDEIWPVATETLLPANVEWIPFRTGYSPALAQGSAEWPPEISSWDVAVSHLVRQIKQSGCRIALIGCGGLGMVLGSELKKQGVIAIVMGGALQVLFGIKGTRWASHSVIQHFWNDAWIYPAANETPNGAWRIENGCYWRQNLSA